MLLVCACGDDDATPERTPMDAGIPPHLDASATTADADDATDEDRDDSGNPLPSYAQCRGSLIPLHAASVSGRSFSSAVALNTIYVAYAIATCGGNASAHVAEGLALVSMATTGDPGEPQPWLNAGAADCVRTSLPTLQIASGALRVYYASNQGGSPQIYLQDDAGTQPLGDGGVPPVDMAVDDARLFYARGNAIYAQQAGAEARLVLAASEGYAIERIAASELGASLEMVAWTSRAASAPGTFLRVLDPAGGTLSAAEPVGAIGPESGLALASQSARGAVVYSDDQGGMFLRTVELDQSLGTPVRLTAGNQFVSDVAVARYGIGYTIAFRATPMTSGQAVIRLLMVDELGNTATPRVISEARGDGQGIAVHVANDGRLFVVWADPGDDGDTVINVARLDCL